MKINGNTVLITGGATGIGYALTEAFLNRGNTVIICGRREHRLLEAQSRRPELYIKVCDVIVPVTRVVLSSFHHFLFYNFYVLNYLADSK